MVNFLKNVTNRTDSACFNNYSLKKIIVRNIVTIFNAVSGTVFLEQSLSLIEIEHHLYHETHMSSEFEHNNVVCWLFFSFQLCPLLVHCLILAIVQFSSLDRNLLLLYMSITKIMI